jgi:hypothetical protein
MPVINWIARVKPSKEPKFQNTVILGGQGKSIKVPFKILMRG